MAQEIKIGSVYRASLVCDNEQLECELVISEDPDDTYPKICLQRIMRGKQEISTQVQIREDPMDYIDCVYQPFELKGKEELSKLEFIEQLSEEVANEIQDANYYGSLRRCV